MAGQAARQAHELLVAEQEARQVGAP
jgi:hypothetical protein